jgi:hypothetical protein
MGSTAETKALLIKLKPKKDVQDPGLFYAAFGRACSRGDASPLGLLNRRIGFEQGPHSAYSRRHSAKAIKVEPEFHPEWRAAVKDLCWAPDLANRAQAPVDQRPQACHISYGDSF